MNTDFHHRSHSAAGSQPK